MTGFSHWFLRNYTMNDFLTPLVEKSCVLEEEPCKVRTHERFCNCRVVEVVIKDDKNVL